MLRLFVTLVVAAFWASEADAQVSCSLYGNTQVCSNGFTAQTYGNSTFYQQNGRSLGSSQSYGNSTFYNPAPTPNLNIYAPRQDSNGMYLMGVPNGRR